MFTHVVTDVSVLLNYNMLADQVINMPKWREYDNVTIENDNVND